MKPIAHGIILLVVCVQSVSADMVYTLVSDSPQFDASPFGFSGTIATDGSTGLFSDTSFITNWSITLETPGNGDGVFSETLTPADGPFTFFQFGAGTIEVTVSEINILQSGETNESTLQLGDFSAGGTGITWSGPELTDVGSIRISDNDNFPSNPEHGGDFGDTTRLPIATAVPEPSAFMILSLVGLVGGGFQWWRNRRAGRSLRF